jgi:hypothetical protein
MNYIKKFTDIINFGGAGSGNFDHEGRPGEVGGSGEGGGGSMSKREEASKKFDTIKAEYRALKANLKATGVQTYSHPKLMELGQQLEDLNKVIGEELKNEKIQLSKESKERSKTKPVDQTDKGKPASHFQDKASKMTAEDVSKSLSDKGVNNNIYEAYKDGKIDLKSCQELHASIDHNLSDYGEKFHERVLEVNVENSENVDFKRGTESNSVYGYYRSSSRSVSLNEKWASNSEKFNESLLNGLKIDTDYDMPFHPVGTIKGVIDHEIGHALSEGVDRVLTKATGGPRGCYDSKIMKHVGRYSMTNKREQYAEIFSAGKNGAIKDPVIQSYFNAIEAHIRSDK